MQGAKQRCTVKLTVNHLILCVYGRTELPVHGFVLNWPVKTAKLLNITFDFISLLNLTHGLIGLQYLTTGAPVIDLLTPTDL